MLRHAKSKLHLIFLAKWMPEMKSASSKMGDDIQNLGPLRANFDCFIAGSSAAFVLTVHHVCTFIKCNGFFFVTFSFFSGWPCTSTNTFYT